MIGDTSILCFTKNADKQLNIIILVLISISNWWYLLLLFQQGWRPQTILLAGRAIFHGTLPGSYILQYAPYGKYWMFYVQGNTFV